MRRLIFGLVTATLLTSAYADSYYKWVDEDGVTQYTQSQPRLGTNSEEKDTSHAQVSGFKALSTPAPADLSSNENADEEAAKEAPPKQYYPEDTCTQLREHISSIKDRPRIRLVKQDGEATVLNREQILERIAEKQQLVDEHCK